MNEESSKVKVDEGQLVSRLELARQLLYLEQQLDAYQALYDEELDQIRSSLNDCRKKLLTLLPAKEEGLLASDSPDIDVLDEQSWE